jgi:hypothetical protein
VTDLYIHSIIIFYLSLLYNHTTSAHVNELQGIEEILVELVKAEGTFYVDFVDLCGFLV